MKSGDDILARLLIAARVPRAGAEMPFGFDTRVLASLRQSRPNGSVLLASLARGAAMISLVLIALATAGVYRSATGDSDPTNEYAIADSVIQTDLGE